MTGNAKSPTLDASDGDARGTVLAALVRANLEAAGAFGFDVGALARTVGLLPDTLTDADGRVPFERYVALWEAIDADPRALAFGLWLGSAVSLSALGVVGYVMQHAPDVRGALGCLERFNGLLGDGIGPTISERDGQLVLHRVEPPRIARLRSLSIAAPLGTVTLLREMAGLGSGAAVALEVAFQHPALPAATLSELDRAFACPIRFNDNEMRLVLPASILERPLVSTDAGLYAYLERHAESLQARLAGSASLAGRVRELLAARLRQGEPDQGAIARALAQSERTLQRRLADEGVSFAGLLDEVRADLGRMYLADRQLAIFEVAFLLGYSEPSPFNRAFRRWTGQSPSEFRQSLDSMASPMGTG
jgi:AraC-like DNA-binding protein